MPSLRTRVSTSPRSLALGGSLRFRGVSVSPTDIYADDLIPADQAAEMAGVTEATIRQWATRGRIHRFPGRRRSERTLYARPEIEAIVAERKAA